MERVLVPLDGSPLAEAVLPLAEALGRLPGGKLHLMRAVFVEGPLAAQDVERENARTYIDLVARHIAAREPIDVRGTVWDGEPAQVIINAIERERVSLVAMSTHGRSGLDRLRFGSVAESVARRAPVPVLLVRGPVDWSPTAGARILVPLDGSPDSEAVLPVVERIATARQLAVRLLHVVEPVGLEALAGEVLPGMERYLAEVAGRLEARGLEVGCSVQSGSPVEVIEREADGFPPSLVAMSTHGRTGLNRLLMGSVAERVVRAVRAPVLLWRAPESEEIAGRS
jgi:nucleotide-binding universal stress UspA family protein